MEPLWGKARWQIISECLLAFPVTVAFHLRGCMSPQRPNQSNIRGLPRSSCGFATPLSRLLVSRHHQCFCFHINKTTPRRHGRRSDQLPRCLPAQYLSFQRETYLHVEQVLSCVSMPLPQPTLFITLAVKAKYEHTYEYMNK